MRGFGLGVIKLDFKMVYNRIIFLLRSIHKICVVLYSEFLNWILKWSIIELSFCSVVYINMRWFGLGVFKLDFKMVDNRIIFLLCSIHKICVVLDSEFLNWILRWFIIKLSFSYVVYIKYAWIRLSKYVSF